MSRAVDGARKRRRRMSRFDERDARLTGPALYIRAV